jgi:hypothetical protein
MSIDYTRNCVLYNSWSIHVFIQLKLKYNNNNNNHNNNNDNGINNILLYWYIYIGYIFVSSF